MKNNPFSLENKTIFVTGASSGIGRAIAIECSKMGATVIITGRNVERLNETFYQLEGSNHLQVIADLQIVEQTAKLIEQLPLLDGVVHSAGIVTTLPFQFITQEKLDNIFSINFMNPTLLCQQLLKQKKINKGASIVWISSIAGTLCSSPGSSMYSASKGAINGIIKGMAIDLAPKGIRVNSINPGVIETDFFSKGVITKEQIQEEVKKYPLKRYGKPEEVGYGTVYLLSNASAWITGSHLLIDGGYTLL
jgi:NAD(P)-dependent dehydrogenase (short-subunit alcohol dehydrogenase family)